MAFFDELGRKLSGVSRVAARKAKEMTDIGGLKIQIADENRKLNKLYENLGREYFDMYKESPDEDLAGLVNQVKNLVDKISGLQEEILKVEAESAAQAEADRQRREAEAEARRVAVAEAEMREVNEEEAEAEGKEAECEDSIEVDTEEACSAADGETEKTEEPVTADEDSKSCCDASDDAGETDSAADAESRETEEAATSEKEASPLE